MCLGQNPQWFPLKPLSLVVNRVNMLLMTHILGAGGREDSSSRMKVGMAFSLLGWVAGWCKEALADVQPVLEVVSLKRAWWTACWVVSKCSIFGVSKRDGVSWPYSAEGCSRGGHYGHWSGFWHYRNMGEVHEWCVSVGWPKRWARLSRKNLRVLRGLT